MMSRAKERHMAHTDSAKKQPDKDVPVPSAVSEAETPAGVKGPGEVEELREKLLRLRADFDNFRKRTLREKGEIYEQANSELMLELLPVLDHFQLGLQSATTHAVDKAMLEGLQLIRDQLMSVLTKFGLSSFSVENKPFDPMVSEAVNSMPSDTVPDGVVLNQVRCGYRLKDKLLRPAQVIVSSGPPETAQKNASELIPLEEA